MTEYQRTTRGCTIDTLRPQLKTAVHAHLERYDLADTIGPVESRPILFSDRDSSGQDAEQVGRLYRGH